LQYIRDAVSTSYDNVRRQIIKGYPTMRIAVKNLCSTKGKKLFRTAAFSLEDEESKERELKASLLSTHNTTPS
jgi:hypothetical protein